MKNVKKTKKKKNTKKLKKRPIIILSIIIILIILMVLLLVYKKPKNKLIGVWHSEGGTVYKFINNKDGVMKTAVSDYKFTYKIEGEALLIDFIDKELIDTQYKYSLKDNKLILKNDKGTFKLTQE